MKNEKQVRHYLNEETGKIEEVEVTAKCGICNNKYPDERPTPMSSDLYYPKKRKAPAPPPPNQNAGSSKSIK